MSDSVTCEGYEHLCVRWADGDLAPGEQVEFGRHLAACPACAADVEAQRRVRAALRDQAPALNGRAPDEVRRQALAAWTAAGERRGGRVVAMRPRPSRQVWPVLRRWVPRSAAAAVLLAVAGVLLLGTFGPRGGVLAGELALDHLKCLLIASAEPNTDAATVEREWQASRGWSIGVPPSSPGHALRLVGLRTCLYHDGQMAHVLYEHHGHRVSLFVMPAREAQADSLELFGQHTRTWRQDGRTYAVVASQAAGPLDEVATYLRAHAR